MQLKIINYGKGKFILDGFLDEREGGKMRFDVYGDDENTFVDLLPEHAVELRDALTSYIDEYAANAGRERLEHIASIVTDEALTPSERLAMLAEEFHTD